MVGCDQDAGARRFGGDEAESGEGTAVGEEATPRSQNQRVNHEHVLIDEVVAHQRANQLSAAEYYDVLARLLLERGYGLGDIAFE